MRWINDCEYIVKKLRPKNRNEEKAIHMKILTTQGDTYTFEYNVAADGQGLGLELKATNSVIPPSSLIGKMYLLVQYVGRP